MNDENIISLFFKRSEDALRETDASYGAKLKRLSYGITGDSRDAEECVNDAYLAAWNKIPPDAPADLKRYLCHTVKNKALDRYKYNSAEKRSSNFTVSLDELAECIPDYREGSGEEKALAEAMSRFLRTQDELHRKVFVRRYWYGDSLAKIAGYYGINERTAATYLFRTRKKLKEYLKKEGYYHE